MSHDPPATPGDSPPACRAPLPCNLVIDPPAEGAWNMAVDEALLDLAADEGVATLRFYQWSEPTLSLGYFQEHRARSAHIESSACPLVRRHSGGGAIIHDRELTYSLALPHGAFPDRDPHALYLQVHRSLRELLIALSGGELAGRIDLCPQAIPPSGQEEPFLCFLRRSLGDLLVEPTAGGLPHTIDGRCKVAGSSQRKRRLAVLQHGSILLEQSASAPQLPGLAETAGPLTSANHLAESWSHALADDLGLAIQRSVLDESIRVKAKQAYDSRFAQPAWTQRR